MTPLELLDKMPLFNGLDKKIIKHFHANTNRREVKKGEIICTPDDDAHNFYIIHSGWVKLFKDTQDGQEAILDILSRFGIFGEDSLFGKRDYGWYAEAVEDVVLLSIPVNILKDAIRKYPDLAVNMITAMSESKRKLDNEVEHFMLQNAPQRLGCFLLKLVQQSEWDNTTQCLKITLPYNKTLVALKLGMTPETLSRSFKALCKINIKTEKSVIHIKNVDRLSNYSCQTCSNIFACEAKKPFD